MRTFRHTIPTILTMSFTRLDRRPHSSGRGCSGRQGSDRRRIRRRGRQQWRRPQGRWGRHGGGGGALAEAARVVPPEHPADDTERLGELRPAPTLRDVTLGTLRAAVVRPLSDHSREGCGAHQPGEQTCGGDHPSPAGRRRRYAWRDKKRKGLMWL